MLNLEKTVDTCIPVFFNKDDFNKFILPHLWQGSRGPKSKVSPYRLFHYILYVLYTGIQWKMLPIEKGECGQPEIHYTRVWSKFKQWVKQGSVADIFYASVRQLQETGQLDLSVLHGDGTNFTAKLGSDHTGYSGHKHQKGNKIVAIQDNAGNILAPMTVETVNQSDMILLPSALKDLKTTCDRCRVKLANNTVLNLDGGFDSRKNRKAIWNVGLKPNIKENPRNRKKTKRGRKRFFDKDLYALRFKCERTFAWEDKFRRVITQFEYLRELAMGFHLLAFALINFRSCHT
jgi:transposase